MSGHRSRFILKGALLFAVWHLIPHRLTRDLDLLDFGSCEVQDLVALFREVCSVAVDDDGIVFDMESVAGEPICAEELYAGVRITLLAFIGAAQDTSVAATFSGRSAAATWQLGGLQTAERR